MWKTEGAVHIERTSQECVRTNPHHLHVNREIENVTFQHIFRHLIVSCFVACL